MTNTLAIPTVLLFEDAVDWIVVVFVVARKRIEALCGFGFCWREVTRLMLGCRLWCCLGSSLTAGVGLGCAAFLCLAVGFGAVSAVGSVGIGLGCAALVVGSVDIGLR